MSWNDFNSADDQANFDIIPDGTLAKVRMTIKPGGFDDPAQGWTGGYATRNATKGSIYLNCEFVVLEGAFARRKMWNLIGLYSPKGPEWGNMGRAFIKGILNSARGAQPKDMSPQAQALRCIAGLSDLDGIEFVGKITVGKDQNGKDKNEVHAAIMADHAEYAALRGYVTTPALPPHYTPAVTAQAPQTAAAATGRPSWAQ